MTNVATGVLVTDLLTGCLRSVQECHPSTLGPPSRRRRRFIVTTGCSYERLPQPSGGLTLALEVLTHCLAERSVAELQRIGRSPTNPAVLKVTQLAIRAPGSMQQELRRSLVQTVCFIRKLTKDRALVMR
jgi:hypothetical protein